MSKLKRRHVRLIIDGQHRQVLLNLDRDLDRIARYHTASSNFAELVKSGGSYRPSIYLGGKSKQHQRELLTLTVEYDRYQHSQGDPRRVFKGDWSFENEQYIQ